MITDILTPGTPAFAALCLAGYALLVNALAYAAFAVDKRRAAQQQSRIPARSLLLLSTLGGWIGAKLGQRGLRQMPRRQPFGILLNLSVLVLPGLIATALILQSDLTWDKVSAQASAHAQSLFASQPSAEAPALPRRFGPGSDAKTP